MNPKEKFIANLTQHQKQSLQQHFDTIYECPELTDHEYKIAYLAWLWATGKVYNSGDHDFFFNENETGVSMKDYEITFEDNHEHGGINLQNMHEYYSFGQIFEKMKW